MNLMKTMLMRAAIGALCTLGAAGVARADAFAQSILVIDNFRLLHANGTAYTASDFSLLGGAVDGHATRQLEADPFPALAAPANFGAADQFSAGGMITSLAGAAGATFLTRAGASLNRDGAAFGSAGINAATTFSFSLGVGEYMTIAFDALPFAHAYASDGAAGASSARASMAWSISVLDLSTGASVFSFQPEQLNGLGNVSRSGAVGGASVYAPGWLAFSATTDLLLPGATYQLTIAQSTFGGALQAQQMPEPGTLAIFGAGLLALAALTRVRPGNFDWNQRHRM